MALWQGTLALEDSFLRFILSFGVTVAQHVSQNFEELRRIAFALKPRPFFDDVPWAQPPEPRELTPQYHGGHVCSGFDEQWAGISLLH